MIQLIADILICIGPEGGYQEKEINAIIEMWWKISYHWVILYYVLKLLRLDH